MESVKIAHNYGENNIIFYNLSSYGQQINLESQPFCGRITLKQLKEKETGKVINILSTIEADGMCYVNECYYKIEKVNNKIEAELICQATCDKELEAELRANIDHLSSEDTFEAEFAAHRLKYIVNGNVVSESEYTEFLKDFDTNYDTLKVIK